MSPAASVLLQSLFSLLVLSVVLYHTGRQIRYYQKRNAELSTLLAEVAEKHSEELLNVTRKHSSEREAMRTELLLQCDSMLRNILASLKEGLTETSESSGRSSGG